MSRSSPTCPECERAEMTEDDHVYICPACGYETSEPFDDEEDPDDSLIPEQEKVYREITT